MRIGVKSLTAIYRTFPPAERQIIGGAFDDAIGGFFKDAICELNGYLDAAEYAAECIGQLRDPIASFNTGGFAIIREGEVMPYKIEADAQP